MMKRIAGFLLLCELIVPAVASAEVREVVITFKTHFDIGYTDLASNVVQRYRTTMIDQALKVVDQNRALPPEQQFVWTIPGWPMSKILEDWPGQTPERKRQILQAFKDGRFVVHGLPFTMHTELLEPEDLVRGLGFASRLSRDAGLALPRDAKMTDVPCHSWILPTLLKHAGIDFLHLGCNSASSSPDVPPLFWWEGPDGSRLLTMYTASGYGTGLVPPKDWPYRTWLALEHTGDNHGPPTPEEVKKLLTEAAQKLPGVKVRIGRLSDFADAIIAEKADIPVVRGDMPDTWIHGPMCDPAGAKIARNIRPALGYAESLNTLLHIWGVAVPDRTHTFADAREQSLLYGEHTWGGALSWVTAYGKKLKWGYGDVWKADRAAGRFTKLEASWAEHTAYIEKARDLVTPILEDSMRALAQSVGPEGSRVVVFNPLPWKRDGVAHVKSGGTGILALKSAEGGPAVAVTQDGDDLYFVARDIPAMGYRTFVPAEAAKSAGSLRSDAQAGVIENESLKVTLDPKRGGIRSVLDKRTGRELVDQSSTYILGQYLYERFDADQVAAYTSAYVKNHSDWAMAELGKPAMPPANDVPYERVLAQPDEVRIGQSPMSVVATLHCAPTAGLSHGVTISAILYTGEPYLDLEVTVHDKPADNWPEAGWICLPVNVRKPQFRLGRLGGIADPARDFIRGSNHDLQAVNTGVTISDAQGRGVGVCPLDSPLVSLDRPGLFRYSPDFVPSKPVVFVNLFNNQWTTNFRLWNEGTWTMRVRLWAFDRFDAQSSLITPALEARYSLLARVEGVPPSNRGQDARDTKAGTLPATQKGLEISARGTLVTAFGANPDGPGTVLRLWEYAGAQGPCEVHLPAGLDVKEVQPANLRGEPVGKPLSVEKDTFTVNLTAFAPVSFIIPTASKGRP
jgi:alpha-mannosidase